MAVVERFVFRELSEAETPEALDAVRMLQRLAVGLRRKLASYQ